MFNTAGVCRKSSSRLVADTDVLSEMANLCGLMVVVEQAGVEAGKMGESP